jgi:hypothetical protein
MGEIHKHIPVKLFTAISFGQGVAVSFLIEKLETIFGASDSKSELFLVGDFTNYYQKEMGDNIKKMIISYHNLIQPDALPDIKIATNQLEKEFLKNANRQVNIDPGYLTQAKIVLATTKDYNHRIYMGKGIYADLHLVRSAKSYRPQQWTYPDYAQELSIDFFNNLREIYLKNLSQKVII